MRSSNLQVLLAIQRIQLGASAQNKKAEAASSFSKQGYKDAVEETRTRTIQVA